MKPVAMPRYGFALVIGAALLACVGVSWMRGKSDVREPAHEVAAAPGNSLESLLASHPGRLDQIRALLESLKRTPDAEKPAILDTMAGLQPIEATETLIAMLRQTSDGGMAERILQALRAATLITLSENRTNLDDRGLIRALEAIQSVFRDELTRPERDPRRFRAAVAAIADVFPGDEAERWFRTLDASLESSPGAFPLTEAELLGRWLEFKAGDVDGRDFDRIAAFIREHPESVADERVKARVVDGMDITPVRPEEVRAAAALLDLLAPAAAPDDSYVRWLKVREHVSGEREPLAGLLASGDALRQSALVLYGGYDLPRELGLRRVEGLKRDLTAAAEQTADEEARDFIREAADAISLGDPGAGVYAAPR